MADSLGVFASKGVMAIVPGWTAWLAGHRVLLTDLLTTALDRDGRGRAQRPRERGK